MSSEHLLLQVLTQVWQVAVIAAVVWILTKSIFKNQSQMAHLLWGLVLIKVITPPVWSSPTSVFSWLGSRAAQSRLATAEESPASIGPSSITSSLTIDLQSPIQHEGVGSGISGTRHSGGTLPAVETSVTRYPALQALVTRSMLVIWLGGVGFLIVASAIRVVAFWCWVRRKLNGPCAECHHRRQMQFKDQLQACTLQMAAELGIRRHVHLHLTISPIGPAVVGLFHPVIILPLRIVEDRSLEFLKPLIAHEFVHIRRGDLFWALLQTLATSLLWFHPLVWLASRRLTLESERSCDEQTIAWLGCSPAAYARSLIDVLERKHQLRVVPGLPGVRPVDVTRNRLERIMRLGHGCRKQTPIWAWAVFAMALAMVLPGAAFLGAQEVADFSRPTSGATDALQPSTDAPQATEVNQPVDTHIEVGDLLERLVVYGASEEQARRIVLSMLPQRLHQPIFRGNPDGAISQSPNARIEGTSLRFVGTAEQIASVKDALAQRRQSGFRQIVLQVRFITISKKRMDQLDIPWRKAASLPDGQFDVGLFKEEPLVSSHNTTALQLKNSPKTPRQDVFTLEDGTKVIQSEGQPAGYHFAPSPGSEPSTASATVSFKTPSATELQVPSVPMPAFYAVVANDAMLKVLGSAQSDAGTNLLQAPRVTAFSGMTVHINDTVQRPFVTDVTPVKGEVGVSMLPTIKIAVEGIKSLAHSNVNEDGTVELLFALNERSIQQVETFTYDRSVGSDPQGNPTESGTTVQIPQLVSRYQALKSNLKRGESLVVTSGLPTLNAASVGGDEMLVVVVSASDSGESGEQSHQQTLGDESITDGWRPTAHDSPQQKENSQERYDRVPLTGPITKGGRAKALDPPSDSEILDVFHKLRKQRIGPEDYGQYQPKNIRIVKEKIADYIDPPRFVPMIGRAHLHHAHYKCSIYFKGRALTSPTPVDKRAEALRVETVYLDHNHFHLVDDSAE